MKAETAYNVIQSLPTDEMQRLYRMLRVVPQDAPAKKTRRRKRKIIIDDSEIREYLVNLLERQRRRNIAKMEKEYLKQGAKQEGQD